jgi:hypothetical protein
MGHLFLYASIRLATHAAWRARHVFFLARLELKAADGRDKQAEPHNDS